MPHVIGHTGTHNIFGDESYLEVMDKIYKVFFTPNPQPVEYNVTPEIGNYINEQFEKEFKSEVKKSNRIWRKGRLRKR